MQPSPPEPDDSQNNRFRRAFDEAPLPAWICDTAQRFTEVNDAFCQMLGQPREAVIGTHISEFAHADERDLDDRDANMMLSGAGNGYTRERRLLRDDGQVVWALVAVRLIRDDAGTPSYFVGQANDLTEYHLREERLRHLADHDPLTGLLNRRGFGRELRRHVSRLARYGSKGALLMLDLDNFKSYNDDHGHASGDEMLRLVADRLSSRLRGGDVLGRIGGDEFAVLLPEATRRQADVVAAALVQSVRERRRDDEQRITASVGIFCFNETERLSEDGAMIGADLAMYAAKHGGRNRYAFSSRTPPPPDPTSPSSPMEARTRPEPLGP